MSPVTLPLWVVASQWILLLALGGLVIMMYRQLGYTLRLKDVGSDRDGLPIGERAPAFEYIAVHGGTGTPGRFEPKGVWSLLLFADPGCVSCQEAVRSLERLAPTMGLPMRTLVVTDADTAAIAAVEAFSRASVEISHVSQDVLQRLYRTSTTPFAYVVDPSGTVRAKGLAGDEPALRKVVGKVEQHIVATEFVAT